MSDPRKTAAYLDEIARLQGEVERLRAVLALFACDCEEGEFCHRRVHCRNYIARATLTSAPAPQKEVE